MHYNASQQRSWRWKNNDMAPFLMWPIWYLADLRLSKFLWPHLIKQTLMLTNWYFLVTIKHGCSQLSFNCLHVWQRAFPPPPTCPSHFSCPLEDVAEPQQSAAEAGHHAASRLLPLNHPLLLAQLHHHHHHLGPLASYCPEEHHLQAIMNKMKLDVRLDVLCKKWKI